MVATLETDTISKEQKGFSQGKRLRKGRERQIGRFVRSSSSITTTESCKEKHHFPEVPDAFLSLFLRVLIQDRKVFTDEHSLHRSRSWWPRNTVPSHTIHVFLTSVHKYLSTSSREAQCQILTGVCGSRY